jgi:hypothetical protein
LIHLLEVAVWDDRPDDPAAKRHPCGHWYRVEVVAESVWISPEPAESVWTSPEPEPE